MTGSAHPAPIERISGTLADVEVDSIELNEPVGRLIVGEQQHRDDTAPIEGTRIRVEGVAVTYERRGYGPDEITKLYPDPRRPYALAYYREYTGEFR